MSSKPSESRSEKGAIGLLSNQEKLLEFKSSIQRELDQQTAQINADIEQYSQSQTRSIEEEVDADCERTIQKAVNKMRLEFTTQRSHALSDMKKKLLLRRDEYASLVFEDTKKRLLAFTSSSAYSDYMGVKLKKAGEEYILSKPRISVREEDLALQNIFDEIFPGCTLRIGHSIRIGGFIIADEEKSYIINESLDNILEEQKDWFFSHSGLRITQN